MIDTIYKITPKSGERYPITFRENLESNFNGVKGEFQAYNYGVINGSEDVIESVADKINQRYDQEVITTDNPSDSGNYDSWAINLWPLRRDLLSIIDDTGIDILPKMSEAGVYGDIQTLEAIDKRLGQLFEDYRDAEHMTMPPAQRDEADTSAFLVSDIEDIEQSIARSQNLNINETDKGAGQGR